MKPESLSNNRFFIPAQHRLHLSTGDNVRILRELQGLSQNSLASACGLSTATLIAIECDRIELDTSTCRILASKLRCHPKVLNAQFQL